MGLCLTTSSAEDAQIMIFNIGVSLIPFQEAHIEQTYRWLYDQKLRMNFGIKHIPTYEEHVNYFSKKLESTEECVFAVLLGEKHIGNCGFKNIDLSLNTGELWVYIGDSSERGKGTGNQIVEALIAVGKETLKFKCIYLHVFEDNDAAIAIYKKYGFVSVLDISKEWEQSTRKVIKMHLELIG